MLGFTALARFPLGRLFGLTRRRNVDVGDAVSQTVTFVASGNSATISTSNNIEISEAVNEREV